jgi:hypothetical protein
MAVHKHRFCGCGVTAPTLLISTSAGRRRTATSGVTPGSALLVIDQDDPERYVEVLGSATVREGSGREFAQP